MSLALAKAGADIEEQDLWAYHSQMKYQEALKAGKYIINLEQR
jgi:acetyl-CoA acetyltransferase